MRLGEVIRTKLGSLCVNVTFFVAYNVGQAGGSSRRMEVFSFFLFPFLGSTYVFIHINILTGMVEIVINCDHGLMTSLFN